MKSRTNKNKRMPLTMSLATVIATQTAMSADFRPMNMPQKNYNESRSNTAANATIGYTGTKTNGDRMSGIWDWETDALVECPISPTEEGVLSGIVSSGSNVFGAGWKLRPQKRAFAWQAGPGGGGPAIELQFGGGMPWATQSWATGASLNNGVVVGAVYGDNGVVGGLSRHATVWSGLGQAALLPVPTDTTYSEAWGVSEKGQIIVGCKAISENGMPSQEPKQKPRNGSHMQGMIWDDSGGFHVVDPQEFDPEFASMAFTGITPDGGKCYATISSTRSNMKGGIYEISTDDLTVLDGGDINFDGMIDLLDLHDSDVLGSSSNGSLVGGSITYAGRESAALWLLGGGGYEYHDAADYLTSLGATGLGGWQLHQITGVSDDGLMISGWGTDPMGNSGIFGATIPEPASLILLSAGMLSLGRRR